ncbi:MAG: alpha/beta hydrolase [Pigmentiphaga sp.]
MTPSHPPPSPAAGGWRRTLRAPSAVGLVLASLAFAAALTPTLIPRTALTQGFLAGIAAAAGYGLGVLLQALWLYLELPRLSGRMRRIVGGVVALLCAGIVAFCLWHAAGWQDSIRERMAMPPLASSHLPQLCAIALACFLVLLALGCIFAGVARYLTHRAGRWMPRRVANLLGFTATLILIWVLASGALFRGALPLLDSSFREFDSLIEPERPQPTRADRSGSASSLISWSSLGRAGREFIASGPSAQQIESFSGQAAQEPIRVYVGLQGADSAKARARLALEELKRAGGFERATLIVITPTGTGWIDPAAMDTVEYLLHGDVASVAMQYSYLSSPLSLLAHPEYGNEAARALFTEIYAYWTTLPRDSRPRLYLHGLSLGAMNSARSVEFFDIFDDPIDGAVWSGPPFASRTWRSITNGRNPGSPAWRPEFRDGRLVRFMNQDGSPVPADAPWGSMRIVYLQYASDAITFFDPHDFYRPPAWLETPRGPDVSPQLRWYPVVSMLQLALDMMLSTEAPLGYGHVYAPEHYADAWILVAGAEGWTPRALSRLKTYLANEARREMAAPADAENPYERRGG